MFARKVAAVTAIHQLLRAIRPLAVAAALLWAAPAMAAQNSCVTPGSPLTMAGLATFLNNCFVTIGSTSSGATPPAIFSGSAQTFQLWADSSATPSVALRINDGTQWVPIGTLNTTTHSFSITTSQVPSTISAASYTVANGDSQGSYSVTNAAAAIALPQAGGGGAFLSGWYADYKNGGSGTVTFTPTVSTIDGGATLVLYPGQTVRILSNGTNYVTALGLTPAASPHLTGLTVTGAAVVGTLNGLTVTSSTGTLTLANGKTLTANNSLTLSGTDGKALVLTNGLTVSGNDGALSFGATGKTLTVNNSLALTGTDATVMTFPGASDTVMGLNAVQTVTAAKTFASATLILAGSGSGSTTVNASAAASGTITIPAATDTLVGKATTDALTNKTFNTAATGNVFQINGNGITAVSGTGATVCLTVSCSLTTPTLGVATATSINKMAITAPATSSTLAVADGKTFTASNTITLAAGADGQTFTFPATGDTVVTLGATQTLTAKTLTSPTINGGTHTAVTSFGLRSSGSGAFDLTLANSENLTAGRTLTLTVNDAARTISLAGNLTIGGTFSSSSTVSITGAFSTAAAFTQSGAFATTLTATNTTNSTLPAGTHTLAGLDVAQTWSAAQSFNSADLKLNGATSGALTVNCAATCGTSTLTLPGGTTDFSATGGTSQVVKQTSSGGAFTVAQLAASDMSNGTSGSGAVVLVTGAALVTPALGVATATSINKVAITAPATSATLTIADGKTVTHNATTTFAGTDGKTLTISNSGTLAGGDAFTLAIAAGKTLTVSNSITLAGTDSTVMTFPTTSATVARTDAGQTFTGTQTFSTPVALGSGGSGQATALAARGASGFNIDDCTSTGDANYTIAATNRCVYHTALSAPRSDTLPAANALNPGQGIWITDFRGVATGTNTITLARAGADTINGVTSTVVVNAQFGIAYIVSDGSSRWTTMLPGTGGGGSGTVTQVNSGFGLSGGPITNSGTLSAPLIASFTHAALGGI